MRTPLHWHERGFIAELLLPFSLFYFFFIRLTTWWKSKKTPYRCKIPVICVGNIIAGGSGKTPIAIALAEMLKTSGKKPVFVSKGYGGSIKTATKVTPDHNFKQVGDEPLLLAQHAECVVGAKRKEAAKLAENLGADVIIMDDGLQNPTLHKDLSLIIFDGKYGIGNGLLIPAGPLRDRWDYAMNPKACDKAICCIIGEDKAEIEKKLQDTQTEISVTHAEILLSEKNPEKAKHIAFSGIAYPDKFFDRLEAEGYELIEKHYFADHYKYKSKDWKILQNSAKEHAARLITTTKDMVRLKPDWQKDVEQFAIEAKFVDEAKITDCLKDLGLF